MYTEQNSIETTENINKVKKVFGSPITMGISILAFLSAAVCAVLTIGAFIQSYQMNNLNLTISNSEESFLANSYSNALSLTAQTTTMFALIFICNAIICIVTGIVFQRFDKSIKNKDNNTLINTTMLFKKLSICNFIIQIFTFGIFAYLFLSVDLLAYTLEYNYDQSVSSPPAFAIIFVLLFLSLLIFYGWSQKKFADSIYFTLTTDTLHIKGSTAVGVFQVLITIYFAFATLSYIGQKSFFPILMVLILAAYNLLLTIFAFNYRKTIVATTNGTTIYQPHNNNSLISSDNVSDEPSAIKTTVASHSEWQCANCGNTMPTNYRICSVCGSSKPSSQKTNPSYGDWQCTNCGKINSHYVGTCGCGTRRNNI